MERQQVFISSSPWKDDRKTETLVIHCSAYDYRTHFVGFMANGLNTAEYDVLAVPGGIQIFTMAHFFPKFQSLVRRWVEFLVEKHGLKRIVVLGHDDCSWYKDFRYGPIHFDLKQRQFDDLKAAAATLRSSLGVVVEVYFAHPKDGKVVFDQID